MAVVAGKEAICKFLGLDPELTVKAVVDHSNKELGIEGAAQLPLLKQVEKILKELGIEVPKPPAVGEADHKEIIPDAPPGAAPDLATIREGVRRPGPASEDGKSVGGESAFSMVSTTLSGKGLDGAPVAEKVISKKDKRTHYYRYRVPPSTKYVKKEYVIKLGFAWYPSKTDPKKGDLRRVNEKGLIGKFFKHDAAKAVLARMTDIANMDDFIDADEEGFQTPDEGLDTIPEEPDEGGE